MALLNIVYKDKGAADQHMVVNKLTFKDICRQVEGEYRNLLDKREWPPASNPKDSKRPPTSFAHMAVDCGTPMTRAEVLNLIQTQPATGGGRGPPRGNCHECGQAGHWRRECLKLKTNNSNTAQGNGTAQQGMRG